MQALDGGVHVAGVSQIEQARTMTLETQTILDGSIILKARERHLKPKHLYAYTY